MSWRQSQAQTAMLGQSSRQLGTQQQICSVLSAFTR